MKHKHAGTITSIGDSYGSPDHVNISVAHGRKKKAKKGEVGYGDSRPTSSITLPREHAKHYAVGQRVHLGMGPAGLDAESRYRKTVRSIITPKKR